MTDPIEFIKARIFLDEVTDCWVWPGNPNRYPTIVIDNETGLVSSKRDKTIKVKNVHRWIYQHFYGKISNRFHLDHLCENKRCVNPNHLEVVSQGENNNRIWKRKKLRSLINDCREFLDLIPFEMLQSGSGWIPSKDFLIKGASLKEEMNNVIDKYNLLQGTFEFRKEIKFEDL